jgi:hypothetical protein
MALSTPLLPETADIEYWNRVTNEINPGLTYLKLHLKKPLLLSPNVPPKKRTDLMTSQMDSSKPYLSITTICHSKSI